MSLPDRRRLYSVRDYMSWPDDVRCELIGGEVFDMAAAPSLVHQDVVGALYALLRDHLRATSRDTSPCRAFVAPVDVVLSDDTVLQPDVMVVCDPEKLKSGLRVDGAPDLVVEVLSAATALKDQREKRALYRRFGVREYLMVSPDARYLEIYRLQDDGAYGLPVILGPEDTLELTTVPGIEARLADVFGWPLPEQG